VGAHRVPGQNRAGAAPDSGAFRLPPARRTGAVRPRGGSAAAPAPVRRELLPALPPYAATEADAEGLPGHVLPLGRVGDIANRASGIRRRPRRRGGSLLP